MVFLRRASKDGTTITQIRHVILEEVSKMEAGTAGLVEEDNVDDLVNILVNRFNHTQYIVR